MQSFLRHWYLGEEERAWEMIAPADRDVITAVEASLEKAGVKPPQHEHEHLLVRRVPSPYALKKTSAVGQVPESPKKGDTVTVKLEFRDGRVHYTRLDHDGERWLVRLTQAGAAAPDDASE